MQPVHLVLDLPGTRECWVFNANRLLNFSVQNPGSMSMLRLANVCGDVDEEWCSVDRQNLVGTGVQTISLPCMMSTA